MDQILRNLSLKFFPNCYQCRALTLRVHLDCKPSLIFEKNRKCYWLDNQGLDEDDSWHCLLKEMSVALHTIFWYPTDGFFFRNGCQSHFLCLKVQHLKFYLRFKPKRRTFKSYRECTKRLNIEGKKMGICIRTSVHWEQLQKIHLTQTTVHFVVYFAPPCYMFMDLDV